MIRETIMIVGVKQSLHFLFQYVVEKLFKRILASLKKTVEEFEKKPEPLTINNGIVLVKGVPKEGVDGVDYEMHFVDEAGQDRILFGVSTEDTSKIIQPGTHQISVCDDCVRLQIGVDTVQFSKGTSHPGENFVYVGDIVRSQQYKKTTKLLALGGNKALPELIKQVSRGGTVIVIDEDDLKEKGDK